MGRMHETERRHSTLLFAKAFIFVLCSSNGTVPADAGSSPRAPVPSSSPAASRSDAAAVLVVRQHLLVLVLGVTGSTVTVTVTGSTAYASFSVGRYWV